MMEYDPLGNPLLVSVAYTDCPYLCSMTLPHKHSLIFCRCSHLVADSTNCRNPVCPYQGMVPS